MIPSAVESIVGVELLEQPLLRLDAFNWRPTYATADGGTAVLQMRTETLSPSLRKRIDAALARGTRVWAILPQESMGIDAVTQEFLLARDVGVIAPDPVDLDIPVGYENYAETVRKHGLVLEPTIASPAISNYLRRAREVTGDQRGKALERALAFGCSQVAGWQVRDVNLRTANEELDVVVRNNSARAPWNGSGYILLEAKNWSSNVGRDEYDTFHMKVKERGGVVAESESSSRRLDSHLASMSVLHTTARRTSLLCRSQPSGWRNGSIGATLSRTRFPIVSNA